MFGFGHKKHEHHAQAAEHDTSEPIIFNQHLSEDGLRIGYAARQPDGTVKEFMLPTMPLGVRFTLKGIVELPDDIHENN